MKKIWLVVLLLFVFLIGSYFAIIRYSSTASMTVTPVTTLDKINLKIVAVKELSSGMMYRIILTNGSNYVIKQNTVYLSYPIVIGNHTTMNVCKVEAINNKLNIRPGEDRMLKIFMPKENYENNLSLDMQHPYLEIKGYINEVKETNHFDKSGSAKLPPSPEKMLFDKPVFLSISYPK